MKILLILGLVSLTLVSNSVQALTIDQAVADALQHNPQIQQFLEIESAASARTDVAKAPFWPRIDTNYRYWWEDRDPNLDNRKLSVAEARADYNLFNGGSDWFRLHEARYKASAANYKRRSIVADIVLEAKKAYIEILRAKRNVATEGKSVELLAQQRHDTQLRLEQGLIARNDLLRVDVEMATAQQRLALAKGRYEIARNVMAKTLGRTLGSEEQVADFSLQPVSLQQEEVLRQVMFTKRSELHFLRSLLAGQEAGRKAVQGDLMPDVDLILSYTWFDNNGLPEISYAGYDSETKAIVQASWTLFSGFDTSYELIGRKHEIRSRQEEIKATEDQLTLQLQTALEAFRVSERNLATAITAVVQAEENYRVNDNRYQANVASTVDLLDAQEFLTRARNEKVKAQYDLFLAEAVIERVLERGPTLSK